MNVQGGDAWVDGRQGLGRGEGHQVSECWSQRAGSYETSSNMVPGRAAGLP